MTLIKCVSCTNSAGVVERDGKLYECMCSTLRRIGSTMPPYLRRAIVKPGHINLPLISKPKQHYYILSSWSDMKAVIKLLMISNSNKVIRLTSDREIRDVYVGSKSKKMVADDSASEFLNSLEDLVESPDIVIIKTNELYYKNKAASGALNEAISIRLDRDKPLWVINRREEPFAKGSHAWSESINELLHNSFNYVEIPQINSDNDDDFSPEETVSVSSNVIQAPRLNRANRKTEPAIEPIFTNDEPEDTEPDSGPVHDSEDFKSNNKTFKIDSSADIDDDYKNPLEQYGSGLGKKNSKFRNRR